MNCPHCKAWASCLQSRPRSDGSRYRRYLCANGHRFTTREKVEALS